MPKKQEDWMNTKWRPMMGWMYMLVCTMDFVVFPILWSIVQVVGGGRVESQWSPITLQGAGLFHMAMGAILGITAFGRTKEKLAEISDTPVTQPTAFPTQGYAQSSPQWPQQSYNGNNTPVQPIATTPSGKAIVPQDYQPLI